jgi:hypothetical protein
MRSTLARRIGKLEEARKPIVRAPCVVRVGRGETTAEALARFRAKFPGARGHLLVVPERVRTPEDEAAFAVEFKRQQERSLAEAKSRRPQENS